MPKIEKDRLVVYYNQHTDIDSKLDEDLERVLKKHGYYRDGSGMNMVDSGSWVRDISFRKKK